MKLMVLGPSDIIWIYFMLASVIAITATIPILAFQIWLFVKPALKPNEIKATLAYIPALFFLFIIGLAFGYFVIFPMIYQFLLNLGGDLFLTNFTVEKYFKFLFNMTIPFGVLFELPVVIMFLTSIGLLNPYVLQKVRKYAYFILVVVAVCITPPDFMSDFVVAVPLLLLYEISITLSKWSSNDVKSVQHWFKQNLVVERNGTVIKKTLQLVWNHYAGELTVNKDYIRKC